MAQLFLRRYVMKKVLISDPVAKETVEILKRGGLEVDVKTDMSPEQLIARIGDYNAIVVRSATKVRKEVIDAAKNLELIARGGVGLDNIDVEYAEKKGIKVINTPSAPSISVAEITIGHMLAFVRSIPQATASLKAGKWEKKKFKGTEVYGKMLGIIGIGRIGQEVAVRALGLGMRVQTYDPFCSCSASIHTPQICAGTLELILRESDFISLHIPFTDQTHNMIGKKEFNMMKDGVVILNCARGGIVDEKALLEALKSGKVRGACLDVFETEPPGDNPLLKLDNVIATPHIGSATVEAQFRVGTEVADLVVQHFRG
jgi:D-3-phosphoglycerate dehydrogenase